MIDMEEAKLYDIKNAFDTEDLNFAEKGMLAFLIVNADRFRNSLGAFSSVRRTSIHLKIDRKTVRSRFDALISKGMIADKYPRNPKTNKRRYYVLTQKGALLYTNMVGFK